MTGKPDTTAKPITPGDLRFAAATLLGAAQDYRMTADARRRRGSEVVAIEMARDADRLMRVAHRLNADADNAR